MDDLSLNQSRSKSRRLRTAAAIVSVFLPGVGQLVRRRFGSGIFFILLFVLSAAIMKNLWKGYHPTFISVIAAFAAVWLLNIVDAFKGPVYPKAPCRQSCPAGLDAVGYVNLVSRGRYDDALALISRKTPLVGVLGYVCNAPCEEKCARSGFDEPIAIRHLKAAVARYGKDGDYNVEKKMDKSVAIIGSGPAGLTAAHLLLNRGYRVSMLESYPYLGGMLRLIPEYRLPRAVLDAEIGRVTSRGLDIHVATRVGNDITFEEICTRFDAVFVAAGGGPAMRLGIDGEELKGVIYGIDFLRKISEGEKHNLRGTVLVIGGGNVATDCARTALRLGAEKVSMVCLETRDLGHKNRMPAFECEITEAEDEGITIEQCLGPKRILEADGFAVGIETRYCTTVYDEKGRWSPDFDESVAVPSVKADTIIVATGQKQDLSFLPARVPRGVRVAKSWPTVVEAVAEGIRGAEEIDRFLRGAIRYAWGRMFSFEDPLKLVKVKRRVEARPRLRIEMLPREKRKGFETIERIGPEKAIEEEANRCLNCPHRFW